MTAPSRVLEQVAPAPAAPADADVGPARLHAHFAATLEWLKAAQDAQPDGGVSALYTLARGWHRSFPETTGYIIPTMVNAWQATGDQACYDRAVRMGEWLLGVQHGDGSFPGDRAGSYSGPSVFNTGQILFGLVRLHQVTGEARYLEAAHRAGTWLAAAQDADGAWRRWDYLGSTHTYNTRTAWALLLVARATGDAACARAGRANVQWAVGQADPTGFFAGCAFDSAAEGRRYGFWKSLATIVRQRNLPAFYTKASLHAIAYTIQGLLESAWLLEDEAAEAAARRAAQVLARHQEMGLLAGYYGTGWRREAASRCLTGIAQLCIVWTRLHEVRGESLEPALRAGRYLLRVQKLESRNPALRGALAGSDPLYGLYQPFRYPNWAAKFWADALLLLIGVTSRPEWLPRLRTW
jgi:hypothetical protein